MKDITHNHRNAFFMGLMMLWHDWPREKVAEEIKKYDNKDYENCDMLTLPHMHIANEATEATI
jgi:hypothetical protein